MVLGAQGNNIHHEVTVTDYEPPGRLGIASEVSGVKAAAMLELAAADGGGATELSFAMEISGSGMTRFMEPMIAGAARGDIEASLQRLQSRFSSGA